MLFWLALSNNVPLSLVADMSAAVPKPPYPKPPITEGVIHLAVAAHVLIAAVACLPFPVGALSDQWKAIACTAENPTFTRGETVTIHFTENGQVQFGAITIPQR
jgi:hypothetical protein